MADGQEAPYIEGGGEHNETFWYCSACLVFHSFVDICHSPCLLAGSSQSLFKAQAKMCVNVACVSFLKVWLLRRKRPVWD